MKKKLFLILLIAFICGVYFFGGFKSFSLVAIQSQLGLLQSYVKQNYLVSIVGFFSIYVMATAFSFPGATLLTLLAGALFGLFWGFVVVSFASTTGATIAFLGTRYFFREFVETNFHDFIEKINKGLNKEGAFYLLSLRLIPAVPFFVVNLVFGLTQLAVWRFFVFSQIGMIPGTLAYVNAGEHFGQLNSLSGLLSPTFLFALTLLGILPWIVKAVFSMLKQWKINRQYSKPKHFDYNLVVIGAGAAGLVTSFIGAAVKAKVALIENHLMGGDCLNYGCVPSKALIRSAAAAHQIKHSSKYGIEVSNYRVLFSQVMERLRQVIKEIEPHDSVERYSGLGVDCLQGHAFIKTPFEVVVNGRTLTTKNIVIATGAEPFVPQLPGISEVNFLTSESLWKLKELPRRLLVVGGGAIGCEISQAFSRLGSEVILLERGSRVLPRADHEASALIQKVFETEKIRLVLEAELLRVLPGQAVVKIGDQEQVLDFDQIIFAMGRRARTKGFGLEALGINLNSNMTIEHDEFMATKFPNIFVCGDCAGPYQLTHVAAHQAWYAAVNALFSPLKRFKQDLRVIPSVTFTDPEVAQVGLTEASAKEKNLEFQSHTYDLSDLDRAICDGENTGFVKILTAKNSDQILGATLVGRHSGEYLSEIVLAMKYRLGLNKILGTIHAYPTWAESNKYAAGKWKAANAPQKILLFLDKFHSWRRS